MHEFQYYAKYRPSSFFWSGGLRESTYEALMLVGPSLWPMPAISATMVAIGALTSWWMMAGMFALTGVLSTGLIAGCYAVCGVMVLREQRRYAKWRARGQAFWTTTAKCRKRESDANHRNCLPADHAGWELTGETPCQQLWPVEAYYA